MGASQNIKQNLDGVVTDEEPLAFLVETADEAEMKIIDWIWKDWIPAGELTVIAGYEQTMKSTMCIDIAANVTRGNLPGQFRGAPRNVMYIANEDSWESVLVPRFRAARADLSRMVRMRSPHSQRSFVSAVTDLDEIEKVVRQRNIGLIVFDPISSALSGAKDVNSEEGLREALGPVIDMADRHGVSLLGIKHFTKLDSTDPAKLMGGNRAWSYIARSTIMVVSDPDRPDHKVVGVHKTNITKYPTPQRFSTGLVTVDIDGQPQTMPTIRWEGDSPYTPQEALERTLAHKRKTERDEKPSRPKCSDWLIRFLLDNGPTKRQEVIDANEELLPEMGHGAYSESALNQAWKAINDAGLAGPRRRESDGEAVWSVVGISAA